MSDRSYQGMLEFQTFEERFNYLRLDGRVGKQTFGYERWLNQSFYTSRVWRSLREQIILRDEACDLGVFDRQIHDRLVIHHIVPMTPRDFEDQNPLILDPNNLITTTHDTHNAIHYGDESHLQTDYVPRQPGDTIPWR